MNEQLIRDLSLNQPHRQVGFILGTKVFEASNHSCGDEVTLQVEKTDGKITKLIYKGSACSICLASAEFMCKEVEGQMLLQVDIGIEKQKMLAAFSMKETDKRATCALLPYRALEQLKNDSKEI